MKEEKAERRNESRHDLCYTLKPGDKCLLRDGREAEFVAKVADYPHPYVFVIGSYLHWYCADGRPAQFSTPDMDIVGKKEL